MARKRRITPDRVYYGFCGLLGTATVVAAAFGAASGGIVLSTAACMVVLLAHKPWHFLVAKVYVGMNLLVLIAVGGYLLVRAFPAWKPPHLALIIAIPVLIVGLRATQILEGRCYKALHLTEPMEEASPV